MVAAGFAIALKCFRLNFFDLGQVKTLRFLDTLNIYCSKVCLIFLSLSRSFHILETMQRAWLLLLLGWLKIASGFKVGI